MRVLVTGGGGFLGKGIVRRLIARGDTVCILQRSPAPDLTKQGAEVIQGDIAEESIVRKVTSGCDLVFHVAAKAGVWGRYADFHQANVVGTENILKACASNNIKKLVFTSSPSVVFDGHDENGIDESAPYPRSYLCDYPKTKAIAERAVIAANGLTLATVSIRPHLIWGPGDNHLFPRLVERAKQNRLRRVGDGNNLVDTTYIDNAVDAHILAADRLDIGSTVAGKTYFISNGEPFPLWKLVDRMLACAGIAPITSSISAKSAYALGFALESFYKLAWLDREPPMTRFVAKQLSTAHWFRLDAARRDLGYFPKVSVAEGLNRLAESLKSDGSNQQT